jgi:hypothetical protein
VNPTSFAQKCLAGLGAAGQGNSPAMVLPPRLDLPAGRIGGKGMALSMEEQLRVVGRWLDVQSARSFRLTLDAEAIGVDCEDGVGRSQHRTFTESRLQRMWLLARTSGRDAGTSAPGSWGQVLRALAQLLQAERITPSQIWSDEDSVRVLARGRTAEPERWYAGQRLLAFDTAAQQRRRLQAVG